MKPSAKLIREYRERAGLSQAELASKLGLTRWTINRIEAGKRGIPPERAAEIEAITGIDARDLLGIPTRGRAA